jgi:hypothetical protein
MHCQSLALASRCCHNRDPDARRCMDGSASLGCETHRVNELVVRLSVVQLLLEEERFSVVLLSGRHCSL